MRAVGYTCKSRRADAHAALRSASRQICGRVAAGLPAGCAAAGHGQVGFLKHCYTVGQVLAGVPQPLYTVTGLSECRGWGLRGGGGVVSAEALLGGVCAQALCASTRCLVLRLPGAPHTA